MKNTTIRSKNLNYMWNFGVLAGLSLAIMIITGIVLAMSYTAHVDYAFDAVEGNRDLTSWMIRYIHMNAASFFFIVVYIHIFRGLYYGSYKAPRELLWILGVVIFLLMMALRLWAMCCRGADELLGCNSDYQLVFSYSCWAIA